MPFDGVDRPERDGRQPPRRRKPAEDALLLLIVILLMSLLLLPVSLSGFADLVRYLGGR